MSERMPTKEPQNRKSNENEDAEPRNEEEQNDSEKTLDWVMVNDESISHTENNDSLNWVRKKKQTDEHQQKQRIEESAPENFSRKKYFLLNEERKLKCFQNFMDLFKAQIPDLHEVHTVEECDFILVFCPVLSQPDSDTDLAPLQIIYQSALKPVVLVVLNHTIDDECTDQLLTGTEQREKTFKIEESLAKIIYQLSQPTVRILPTGNKYFVFQTGTTLNSRQKFSDHLKTQKSALQEVNTVEDCDFILVFCPVASRSGTEIESALQQLNNQSELKPAVLVVLHHTFDPECAVPDSRRHVERENTIAVEDQGLLQCSKIPEKSLYSYFTDTSGDTSSMWTGNNYFVLLMGNTLNSHRKFIDNLKTQISALQEVNTVKDCDFILVFCPVTSRYGTAIESALQKLNMSEFKPAVLVVLHHTFNPECVVPDSSRHVKRENTITVDCLFHEDQGLLQCPRNVESLNRVIQQVKSKIPEISWYSYITDCMPQYTSSMWTGKKYFVLLTGNTQNSHQKFIDHLKTQISAPQEVNTVEDCDFILVFCPVTSRSGTDIELALQQLNNQSELKPAVLVVLHHTFNPECVVLDSSRHVKRENTITVDCLFHEDQGLLQCSRNVESLNGVIQQVKSKILEQNWYCNFTGFIWWLMSSMWTAIGATEQNPMLQEKGSAENNILNEEQQTQTDTSTNSLQNFDSFEIIENVDNPYTS